MYSFNYSKAKSVSDASAVVAKDVDAKLLAAVYLELKGGRERRLELTAEVVVSAAHISSRNDYGIRPRPLPARSSEGERQTHAAFIRDVVKDETLWGRFGL